MSVSQMRKVRLKESYSSTNSKKRAGPGFLTPDPKLLLLVSDFHGPDPPMKAVSSPLAERMRGAHARR